MIRSVLRGSLVLALVAVVAASALGEEKEKKKREKKDAATQMADKKIAQWEKKIQLTDDQKSQIKDIATAEEPAFTAANDAVSAVLTGEQKKGRRAAWKQANADGLKGKERKAFLLEQLNLTDEQKEQMTELDAAVNKAQKSINEKMMAVLTDEQKTAVTPVRKGKGKKKKEAAAAG